MSITDPGRPFDRVRHLEKGQTLEFEEYLGEISSALNTLDDIEINEVSVSVPLTPIHRRLLRKLACRFSGVTVDVRTLTGGLSGEQVSHCLIRSADSSVKANIVSKLSNGKKEVPMGGLIDQLPANCVARPFEVIEGLCGHKSLTISQLVGRDPQSFFYIVREDPGAAALILHEMSAVMDTNVTYTEKVVTLEDLLSPLVSWDDFSGILAARGFEVPSRSLRISTKQCALHGDFHGGNLLVESGNLVLIDFDSQVEGASLIDPLVLTLSLIFHPDSPLAGSAWPSGAEISAFPDRAAYEQCAAADVLEVAIEWLLARRRSDREFWGVVLGMATRQFMFPSVVDDELRKGRAEALIQRSLAEIG